MFGTRRVHISQSTMECLHGEFDVEPGNGGERCDYLRERGIETYLVVVPKGPVGKNGISDVVSSDLLSPTAAKYVKFSIFTFVWLKARLLKKTFCVSLGSR